MRSGGAPLAISASFVAVTMLGSATDQDLPVAPVSVLGHHLGQLAGLAHVKAAGWLHVGVVGGPRRILAELRHRGHREPGVARCDLPQRAQVIQFAGIPRAEEQVHPRVHAPPGEVHDERPQWRQPGAARDHQHVAAIPVDLHAAVRIRQPPPVARLGFGDDRRADHSARDRADVELDGTAGVGWHGRAEVAPSPGPLRHLHGHVLACEVGQRLVELQPDHRDVAGHPVDARRRCRRRTAVPARRRRRRASRR